MKEKLESILEKILDLLKADATLGELYVTARDINVLAKSTDLSVLSEAEIAELFILFGKVFSEACGEVKK